MDAFQVPAKKYEEYGSEPENHALQVTYATGFLILILVVSAQLYMIEDPFATTAPQQVTQWRISEFSEEGKVRTEDNLPAPDHSVLNLAGLKHQKANEAPAMVLETVNRKPANVVDYKKKRSTFFAEIEGMIIADIDWEA